MSHLRFVLAAVALFGFAFAGVSFGMPWASKGFPVMAMRATPPKPDARPPAFEESVKQSTGKDGQHSKTPQDDNDPGRNQMRLTAIQAADAYTQSPCDQAIKAAFVVAASTYLRAKTGKDAEEGTFSTPMDMRVREAVEAAVKTGGITEDEFPAGTRFWATAGTKPHGDAISPCAAGQQAERRTR